MTCDDAVIVLVDAAFPAMSCSAVAGTYWKAPLDGVVARAVQVPAQAPVTVNVSVLPSALIVWFPAKVTVRVLKLLVR